MRNISLDILKLNDKRIFTYLSVVDKDICRVDDHIHIFLLSDLYPIFWHSEASLLYLVGMRYIFFPFFFFLFISVYVPLNDFQINSVLRLTNLKERTDKIYLLPDKCFSRIIIAKTLMLTR